MEEGCKTLVDKNKHVAYMDTFLLEADDVDKLTWNEEKRLLKTGLSNKAEAIFKRRLETQERVAYKMVQDGQAFRVVYSGSKSYHILVRVQDAPDNLEEYKWLHSYLCSGIVGNPLKFDISCNDPARLTRSPITKVRKVMWEGVELVGTQRLIRELQGNVWDLPWRDHYDAWLRRPLTPFEESLGGRRMLPHKKEYVDAAEDLLGGRFFTNPVHNGARQLRFFPGYRLCRAWGFTHEDLWGAGGILEDLDQYPQGEKEKRYWRTRESSTVIQEIDADEDARLDEEVGAMIAAQGAEQAALPPPSEDVSYEISTED
jgi:hypothetical protein